MNMNRIRDNAPPLKSEGPEDIRKDTTVTTSTPATSGHLDSIEGQETRKKRKNTTSSETKRRYNKSAYDTLQITIAKGAKEAIHAAAAKRGLSTAAYITAAINAYEQREIVPPLAKNPYINK